MTSNTTIYYKTENHIPYTYFIRWNELDLNYYGRRTAKDCHPEELFITYFTSSAYVKETIDEYGMPDVIKVHKIFNSIEDCAIQEERFLKRVSAAQNPNWLNKTNADGKFYTTTSIRHNDTDAKTKATNLKRYGVEYPFQNLKIQEKTKYTNLEKYGFENVFQSPEIQGKIKHSNLLNLGVEYPMQSIEVQEKSKQTNLEKYGVEYSFQSPLVRENWKESMLKNWGVEYPIQNPEVQDKIKQTNLEKYGFENPMQNPDIRGKTKQTNLERYGFENVLQSPLIRGKYKESMLKNWGVEYPIQNLEVQDKIKQTNLEKYGFENPMQNPDIQAKVRLTNLNKLLKKFKCESENEIYTKIIQFEKDHNISRRTYKSTILQPNFSKLIKFFPIEAHKSSYFLKMIFRKMS